MAAFFPDTWLDDLRARADIVQIVSSYVPLKKNGHRYVGLCPFHNEKTASFSVDAAKQLYYCFGCKAGGSVIQFIMEMERLDFQEAVRYLADQLNLPLPEMKEIKQDPVKKSKKERMYAANKAAALFFHQNLWQPEGKLVLSYLYDRGLDDGIIRKFGLGASSDEWADLSDYLKTEGFTLEKINEAGLCGVEENRHFDMFRSRAMFPIIDTFGKVVGFGGRAMGKAQPKYLNTTDTLVFNKRKGVYAGNYLKKTRNLSRIILVEGYMDVLALSQFGIQGVVATLGTSLTPEQSNLLKRFAPQVWVAYDGDNAGQQATLRALTVLEEAQVNAKVLAFPDGLDPDDYIRKYGVSAFSNLSPITATAFRLKLLEKSYDLSKEDGRIDYAKAASEVLTKVASPVEMESHLKQIALTTGFTKEALFAQIGSVLPSDVQKLYQPRKTLRKGREGMSSPVEKSEQLLLAIYEKKLLPKDFLSSEDFSTSLTKEIYKAVEQGLSVAALLEQQEIDENRRFILSVFALDLPSEPDVLLQMAEDCLQTISHEKTKTQLLQLNQQLPTLLGEERIQTLSEIQRLTKLISR